MQDSRDSVHLLDHTGSPKLQASAAEPADTAAEAPAPARRAPPVRSADLSIIIPTFNERENIPSMIEAIDHALPDINWEIIFVDDDSPDGTASLVRAIARDDARVRCVHRFRRRGLASACIEGIMSVSYTHLDVYKRQPIAS